jgi:hypothetical protein
VDDLYALPLEEFTQARNARAAELRKEGRREEADEVKRLPKPTAAAWIVNQLARRNRKELERLVEAGRRLREGGDFERSTEAAKSAQAELTRAARALGSPSDAVLQGVARTLHAAAADEKAAARVLEGRLAKELDVVGFVPMAARPQPRQKPAPRPKSRELGEAKERIAQLRREANGAQREADAAARRAERAQAALADAEDRLRRLERQRSS